MKALFVDKGCRSTENHDSNSSVTSKECVDEEEEVDENEVSHAESVIGAHYKPGGFLTVRRATKYVSFLCSRLVGCKATRFWDLLLLSVRY